VEVPYGDTRHAADADRRGADGVGAAGPEPHGEARLVVRAKTVLGLAAGERPYQVADRVGVGRAAAYEWLHRFNGEGLKGLTDHPRPGRPHTYDERAEVIAAALTRPDDPRLPFGSWTLDRLQAYLAEHKGIGIKQTRIDEILIAEGLRWREQETWFGQKVDPSSPQKGAIEKLYTRPPEGAVVVCLDEMGPESAKSFPGQEVIDPLPKGHRPAGRAKQDADYGRRGKGYVFGAFGRRRVRRSRTHTSADWIDFLERVERWIPSGAGVRVRGAGQPAGPPGNGRAPVQLGPPALGVRVPADVRGVPDRAVVEGTPVARPQGPAVRDVARVSRSP
jgi:transposase